MRNVFKTASKSGPIQRRISDDDKSGRQIVMGPDNCTRWKKPITKKTAIELLKQDDNKPGILNDSQRLTLEASAGKNYKKLSPFEKREGENTAEYISRINKLIG